MSNGSLANAVKNNRSIGSKSLEYILSVNPEINFTWLLTDDGTMLREVKGAFGEVSRQPGHYMLGSENPEHEPLLVQEKEVRHIYRIIGHYRNVG